MVERNDDDLEWAMQEDFLRTDPAGLLIARALVQPPLDPVPEDFSAHVAMLATRQPQADGEQLEALLQYGLLGLLVTAGLALGQRYVMDWWATLASGTDPGLALPGWLALVFFCLVLSAAPTFLGSRLR